MQYLILMKQIRYLMRKKEMDDIMVLHLLMVKKIINIQLEGTILSDKRIMYFE